MGMGQGNWDPQSPVRGHQRLTWYATNRHHFVPVRILIFVRILVYGLLISSPVVILFYLILKAYN